MKRCRLASACILFRCVKRITSFPPQWAALWLCGDDGWPVWHVPAPPAWQFGVAYPMPSSMVNNAFTGWSGRTSVLWSKRRFRSRSRRVRIITCSMRALCVLYAPPGEDFFCFEPVDHSINAVNLPGGEAHGMMVLGSGERLSREFRFTVERTGEVARRGRLKSRAGREGKGGYGEKVSDLFLFMRDMRLSFDASK